MMRNWPDTKVEPYWNHWAFEVEVSGEAPQRVLRRFDKSECEFEIAFLEDILATNPNHLDTLRLLAELYTQNGQYREGLRTDQRIVAACPRDNVAHYNLACSFALAHRVDECFRELRKAVQLGYSDYVHMAIDPDLESVRKDDRWAELFGISPVA